MKACDKCGLPKVQSDSGRWVCRPCAITKARSWYSNNKERAKANTTNYRKARPDWLKANRKAYKERRKLKEGWVRQKGTRTLCGKCGGSKAHCGKKWKCLVCTRSTDRAFYRTTAPIRIQQTVAWQKRNPENKRGCGARYYQRNKEPLRINRLGGEAHIKWRTEQFLRQDGRCAFCSVPETNIKHRQTTMFVTDHDHAYDRRDPRGWRRLLCPNCNALYGFAREDAHTLRAALAASLDDHRERENSSAA